MIINDRVLGIRTIFRIGSSLAVVLDQKWCKLNKIKDKDRIIEFDRGSKMTVQKYADNIRDLMIKKKVKFIKKEFTKGNSVEIGLRKAIEDKVGRQNYN